MPRLGARAAWLGLAVAAVAVLAAHTGAVQALVRRRPGRSAAIAVGLASVAVVVLVATPVGSRLGDATDPDRAGGRGRIDEWRVAANVVADHPVVGVGPEGYRTAFHEGVDERYERAHGRRQQPDRAHSAPLDLALIGGLPLLAAWAAVLALVGRAAWRLLRDGAPWERGLAAALVAHWAGQLLLFPVAELEPVAWLLAGLVVAESTEHPTGSGPEHTTQGSVVPGQNAWGRGWVGRGVGVLVVGALFAGVTDLVADHRADRAVDALARGDQHAAGVAADSAADLRPDVIRLHLLAARAAVADEQGALAGLQRVDDALAVSPRDPITLLDRLLLLVQRAESTQTPAHIAEARRDLGARLRVDRFNANLWRLDARLLTLEGDRPAAERSADRAQELTPDAEDP